jgi:hypothetical protein
MRVINGLWGDKKWLSRGVEWEDIGPEARNAILSFLK